MDYTCIICSFIWITDVEKWSILLSESDILPFWYIVCSLPAIIAVDQATAVHSEDNNYITDFVVRIAFIFFAVVKAGRRHLDVGYLIS